VATKILFTYDVKNKKERKKPFGGMLFTVHFTVVQRKRLNSL